MFGRKKSLVGLDIGSHTIKAIEFTEARDSITLTAFGRAVIEPERGEDAVAEAVKEALRDGGIKTKEVATAVCGRSVIVRYISMVPMSDEELRSALRFEADKYIPFDVDEVVLSCQRLEGEPESETADEGDEKEMKVLLVAVKRGLIDDHVALLMKLGLLPRVIDVDSFAAGNAFELRTMYSPRVEDDDRVVGLIDIGASKTSINILRGTTSHFSREIYLAGNDFTEAVARRFGVETEEAEQIKIDPQDKAQEVEEAVLPVIDDLANEVHLSFDYYENQYDRQVEEIYLSGGGAALHGVDTILARIFNRPVSYWDPTDNLSVDQKRVDVQELKASAPQLAVAVGLASRIMG